MNISRPRPRRALTIIVVVAVVALLAACGGATTTTPPPVTGTPIPGGVIELEMTGALKIEQAGQQVASITVKKGETYTFRITNSAGFDHDFHIATDAELTGGGHEHMAGLMPFSSGTQEFTYTFDTDGPLAFGCTVPGHYSVMKGTFTIVP
jgi:uncharacterized cupredoxin-like copper-binding protein